MKTKLIRNCSFPDYWDVTRWAMLLPLHVVFCHRNEFDRRRTVEVIDIENGVSKSIRSVYNCILGWNDDVVILARVSDGRSHLQIDRVGSLNIRNMIFNWEQSEIILVEKYKIPLSTKCVDENFVIGNKTIRLNDGYISKFRGTFDNGWKIDDFHSLVHSNKMLTCINTDGKALWGNEEYYGNQFQGTINEHLVFYTAQRKVIILDKITGQKVEEIGLQNIRSTSHRIYGMYSICNDQSYDSSTIAEGLINGTFLLWVCLDNTIVVMNRLTKKTQLHSYSERTTPFLSQINNTHVLMFVMKNENYGSLVVSTLED